MRSVLAAAAVLVVIFATGPAGAQYAPTSGTLGLSASTVEPGGTVGIEGSGFAPGSDVRITLESEEVLLETAEADARGTIAVSVRIPRSVEPGEHTLKATGVTPDGATLALASTIFVGERSLAFTGFPFAPVAVLAIGLLGSGIFLLRLRARRSTA